MVGEQTVEKEEVVVSGRRQYLQAEIHSNKHRLKFKIPLNAASQLPVVLRMVLSRNFRYAIASALEIYPGLIPILENNLQLHLRDPE